MRSETRSSSAQLALLVSIKTAFIQMLILRPGLQTWLQRRKPRFLPVCLQRCSPPVFTNKSREGHRSRRIAPGVLAAAEHSVTISEGWIYGWCGSPARPASPLHAAVLQGQRSCVGLSLIQTVALRRGITTVTPRIVPEPLQQCTESQLLFSLMVSKPRSHSNAKLALANGVRDLDG